MEGKNLTTGNLLKNMTFMLIPILLTNLLNSIYSIVDGIWIGNTKKTLIFVAISSILNIILDPILIKVGLGIKGAALATAISMFIGMTIAILYVNNKSKLLKIDFKYIKWNSTYIAQLLKLAVPVILQELLIAMVFFIEVKTSNESGIIGSIILFIFPKQFCRIFVSSEEVISMAIIYLSVLRFALIITPIRHLLRGVIVGTGHTIFSFLQIIFSMSVEVVSLFILRKYNIESLMALGIAISICVASELIINSLYYFSNNWKKEIIK